MTLRHSSQRQQPSGFTLVELLVVIGIIAILISILLPGLSAARRQANAVKCASSLREIGNIFKLYSIDNKDYYPPMRCTSNYQVTFNSSPPSTYDVNQTYWMYFLAKYVSHAKFGSFNGSTAQDAAQSMSSILWGCPSFTPIPITGVPGGFAPYFTGYGMNGFPEYTPTFPDPATGDKYGVIGDGISPTLFPNAGSTISSDPAGSQNWGKLSSGTWYKYETYTHPAERALVADCRAYVLEAMKVTGGSANIAGQANILGLMGASAYLWSGNWDPAEASYDFYRHGKYPPLQSPTVYSPKGGQVKYNILYADGHVVTEISRENGFKAARMRFPG